MLSALCWTPLVLAQPPAALRDYQEGRFEEARASLEASYRQRPAPSVRRLLGLTYVSLLDYDRALPLLQQSLAEQPDDRPVRRALAGVQLELNRPARARVLAEPLLAADADAATWYLWGRIQEASAAPVQAEEAYRKALLEADSELYQAAAVRLSRLYLRRGEVAAARRLADSALQRDPQSLDAETLRLLIADLPASMDRDRPVDLTLGYRLEYDDNAPLAPDRGAVIGDDDTEDFRHLLYADLLARQDLGGGFRLFGEAHLSRGWHQDLDAFDFSRQNYVASLGWDRANVGLRLPLEYFHARQDGDRVLSRWSLTPGVYYRFNEGVLLYGYLRLDDNDYTNPDDIAVEDRSGEARSWGALLRLTGADGRGQLRAIVEYGSDDAEGANWDRERLRLYLYGSYRLSERLLLGVGGEYLDDDYDNRHDLFGDTRDDRLGAVFALLDYRPGRHWGLQLQLSHQTADSSLAFYDYDRTVISAGVYWRF